VGLASWSRLPPFRAECRRSFGVVCCSGGWPLIRAPTGDAAHPVAESAATGGIDAEVEQPTGQCERRGVWHRGLLDLPPHLLDGVVRLCRGGVRVDGFGDWSPDQTRTFFRCGHAAAVMTAPPRLCRCSLERSTALARRQSYDAWMVGEGGCAPHHAPPLIPGAHGGAALREPERHTPASIQRQALLPQTRESHRGGGTPVGCGLRHSETIRAINVRKPSFGGKSLGIRGPLGEGRPGPTSAAGRGRHRRVSPTGNRGGGLLAPGCSGGDSFSAPTSAF